MVGFFQKLLDGRFVPHGHCLLWRSDLLCVHVAGDILTTLAYLLIPIALTHLVHKRDDFAFGWIFMIVGAVSGQNERAQWCGCGQ